jgi:hypothetical protein
MMEHARASSSLSVRRVRHFEAQRLFNDARALDASSATIGWRAAVAVGESTITCKSPLNVVKGTFTITAVSGHVQMNISA